MKKFVIFALTLILVFAVPLNCYAETLYNSEVAVRSNILYLKSLDDGTVIFDKNSKERCAPAALTNIAVAMVVLNNVKDIENTKMTVPDNINNILAGTDSAIMLFKGGEEIRVADLLNCILIRSAADASVTLAYGIAGSVDEFIKMMNDYAKNLGCKNTNFSNVTGLDDENHYSTAEDIAIMMADASANDSFRSISTTDTYNFPATNLSDERTVYTTNYMLKSGYTSYYYKYITAAKTGATTNAGRCVALTASKDGYSYVAVVLKGPYEDTDNDGYKENYAFIDSRNMLRWTFNNIKLRAITDTNQTVGEIDVKYSLKYDHVRITPSKQITALVPSKVDTDSVVFRIIEDQTEKKLKAPVKKGDIVGKAEVLYGEQVIATVPLMAAEDVPFDIPGLIVGVLKSIFSSPIIIILLILIIASGTVYFVIGVRYDKKAGKFKIIKGGKIKKEKNR